MNDLIKKIEAKVSLIESRLSAGMEEDSIECDRLLGELASLVQDAREVVDNWWRANRQSLRHMPKRDISEIDLGDLGL